MLYVLYALSYQAPEICALYPLDVPPAMLRAKMRTMFEQNRHVGDVAVLDVLLLKAQQEYQETMNAWKQTSHVMKWFTEEEVRTPSRKTDAGALYVVYPCATNLQPSPRASWRSSTQRATRAVARPTRDSRQGVGIQPLRNRLHTMNATTGAVSQEVL